MALTILHGTIISSPAPGKLDITPGGYLIAQDGRIRGVYAALPECYAGAPVEEYGEALILPAFCDLHLHAPQYPMLGTGMDLPLLDWLNTYTFPAEARFADPDYARDVYRKLAAELIENGTTRVCMFSSLHTQATWILMEELERAGVTGYVGKVNMDRNGLPGVLQEETAESIRETERWLERCGDFTYVHPILTPRFTPSCTDELMAWLGRKAAETGLPIQSHLSENDREVAWVRELHPDCDQYWESYRKFGLWNDRTLMAHCVWSDARERDAMRKAGVTVVHCPDSNVNVCSGTAPVRAMLQEGLKVALGTDIAGGDHISMFDAVTAAIRASKVRQMTDPARPDFLTVAEAWYLGTSAGAAFFGDAPGFAPGNALHAIVLSDDDLPQSHPLSPAERLERCMYRRQRDAIRAVWSDGRKVYTGR